MSVKLRKRNTKNGWSYYLDIYMNGERVSETLNLNHIKAPKNEADRISNKENKIIAEHIRAKREIEISNNCYGLSSLNRRKESFIDYMHEVAKNRNTSKSNYEIWLACIKHLSKFLGNKKLNFENANQKFLEDFKQYLLIRLKPNSASSYFNKVKATFNQAVRDKIIVNNPSEDVKGISPEESEREYLTIEEIRRLWETPCRDELIKKAFIFSCYTGLRFSDIQSLTWDKIKGDQLSFRPRKTKQKVIYLPLNNVAKDILHSQDKGVNNKVFDIRYSQTAVLTRWCIDAGIAKHITFHCGRHTFATLALSNHADIYVIKELLGHSKVQTTAIYTKIIDSKKVDAVNSLPSIA